MEAVVSKRGRVTIPKVVRNQLSLHPGDVLVFDVIDGQIVARKRGPVDVFSKWRGRGRIPGGLTVGAYLKMVRSRA